jgi:N-acetylneuraminic acid mutarotase
LVLNLGIILTIFLIPYLGFTQGKSITAHNWSLNKVSNLPEPVTNGAVSAFSTFNGTYIYVFGGLDSTLLSSGIHRRCYKINVADSSDVTRLPDLPDSLGRIALSATKVRDKIYIVGGYYVFANGREKSSSLVHEFDLLGDTFTNKKIVLPVPIDDHVQDVWKDSLLFIINGWSDLANVRETQIYNPSNNIWQKGSPYKIDMIPTFGACGGIIGNNIYVQGGARSDRNSFPSISNYYKGEIQLNNPTQITWSTISSNDSLTSYRSAIIFNGYGGPEPVIVGGSKRSYNYNARDYTSGKLLAPMSSSIILGSAQAEFNNDQILIPSNDLSIPMDIRDWGILRDWSFTLSSNSSNFSVTYLAGGILENGQVSNQILSLTPSFPRNTNSINTDIEPRFFPNPTKSVMNIRYNNLISKHVRIYNSSGNLVDQFYQNEDEFILDLSHLISGIYFYVDSQNQITKKLIKK